MLAIGTYIGLLTPLLSVPGLSPEQDSRYSFCRRSYSDRRTMKNSIIISLAALGSLAAAASEAPCLSLTTAFPSCVLSCAQEAASKAGCTNTADLACQCNPESSSAIQGLALGCAAACSATDLPAGISAGRALCSCVASHAAATTSGTGTETGTETTGTETTGTETTATGTPHTGALTSEITKTKTSTGTKTGSASETTTTTGTQTETSTTTEATTSGATTTSPTTATPTTTTAGAGIFQVSFAVVAGAILVAAVAL
ncbi:hypothetical protein H634G_06252 [Metarhizium anisopliae BRIP 53293]|uniref:CFEM domain-containing protein n=1 Tax=Metarhizium anisopliae BRIP 53293 TaxID=1291518 RepID=A0A0D9NX20_METAN|nr:hypothetical protein H634G_06252 [Metarhizium anisopliae BRIP 53293]KJK88274.1 hypothetical protein H633G_07874 [Metarhizium anisopliae BRIP 53284]